MTDDTRQQLLSFLHKIEKSVPIKQDEIYLVAQVNKKELEKVIEQVKGKS